MLDDLSWNRKAEMTRMIEIEKSLRTEYHCIFFGYSETYASMIRNAAFQLLLLKPALTPKLEKQIMDFDQAKRLKSPLDYHLIKERVLSELQLIKKLSLSVIVTGSNVTIFYQQRSVRYHSCMLNQLRCHVLILKMLTRFICHVN